MDMPLILPYPADKDSSVSCSSPDEGKIRMSPGENTSPSVQRLERAGNQVFSTISTTHSSRRHISYARTLHSHPGSGDTQPDSDGSDHYDSVMQWLNQQACGGTVKRKRKINKQQRVAANMRERRRMTSLNSAFERLKETIPIFPYEKKLSRIQTLRLAIDYIEFMGSILHQPPAITHNTQEEQENLYFNNSTEEQSPNSTSASHFSPDCVQMQDNKYLGY